MNIYVGDRAVEESIKCATHSRMKQSHNPSEKHWWVEACLANLLSHLAVAKYTHRSRHGITKHWQSLCLTEGGWRSSSKPTNKQKNTIVEGVAKLQGNELKVEGGRERDRNCTITKQYHFLKQSFQKKT